MTLNQIYIIGKAILKEAGNLSPAFDCMCILEHCFNVDRHHLIMCGDNKLSTSDEQRFLDIIKKRATGFPLQYLLGEWEFMGLKFKVGEGVLIPREDTEVLVNECLSQIADIENPKVLDLCAGSGAVGISIGANRTDAEVVCVEYSDEAFKFLKENIKINNTKNVCPLKGDILSDIPGLKNKKFDAIVSNPPYIKTDEIDKLQIEVQNEPRMALDGGKDGLDFYRAIVNIWVKSLNKGGKIAVEVGFDQKNDVINIFKSVGLSDIGSAIDINGISRVISATKLY